MIGGLLLFWLGRLAINRGILIGGQTPFLTMKSFGV